MKKLLLIPTLIFPYMVCLCLGVVLNFNNIPNTTVEIFGVVLLFLYLISFICNLVYILTTRAESYDVLLKNAIIIKLFHIPTYVAIFILGFFMGLMFIMTFPLNMVLVNIDLLTLWISGMISIYSIAKSLKTCEFCSKPILIIAIICQFFFCLDIITLLVVITTIKKNKQRIC